MSSSNDPRSDSPGKLSADETVELAAQLAELAKAGLPLGDGLRALADELPRGHLPGVLRRMAGQLQSGATLESVIESQQGRFPKHLRSLVLSGVRSGRLGEVLEEFVDLQRSQVELRRRLWACVAYPVVLLALMSFLFAFWQGCVVLQMAEIYEEFQAELPAMTVFFIRTARPTVWCVVGGLVLVVGALALFGAMPRIACVQRALYRVPLVGSLWRWNGLAQLSRLMGLLLRQETSLPEALRLTASGLRDAALSDGCRRAAGEVESGRPLAECLSDQPAFARSLIPLVQWGQQSSALPDAFAAAAEMFEGRVQTQGVLLETFLLPFTFLMVAAFVMAFVVAMFMPMISLISKLT